MRGDLIETFKILNKKNNYGANFFNLSGRTSNLLARPGKVNNTDFFSERVIKYYNKLPEVIKCKETVNSFKNSIDEFREKGITNKLRGQFWELSDEIFIRI